MVLKLMEGLIGLFVIGMYCAAGFFATRYLITGSTNGRLSPFQYLIGMIFTPVTVILAVIRWFFSGKV